MSARTNTRFLKALNILLDELSYSKMTDGNWDAYHKRHHDILRPHFARTRGQAREKVKEWAIRMVAEGEFRFSTYIKAAGMDDV